MTLKTYTGRIFDFENISKDSIYIEDIFRSLPRLNRFVGHSSRTYSVGEHTFYCLLMAEKLGYSTREKLLTFIHDFTEAYVSDCPAPLKKLLPAFEKIEGQVELAICEYLGIKPATEEEHYKVKRIDLTMLVLEMRDLTLHDYKSFLNKYTYDQFLDDDDFKLGQKTPTEESVRNILNTLFEDLMKDYKEEYQNGSEK